MILMASRIDAFSLLTPEEQSSLQMQLGFDKSSWEAGSIMGKAHYKYLEIFTRAKVFVKLASDYISCTGSLDIPQKLKLDEAFKTYIKSAIFQRLPIKGIIGACSKVDVKYSSKGYRDDCIIKNIAKLNRLGTLEANALLNLIFEFDRWNNFRILPNSIQEPHGFKRRNKNRYKKLILISLKLSNELVRKIEERYQVKKLTQHTIYVPVLRKLKGEYTYTILRLAKTPGCLTLINRSLLFAFDDSELAIEYGEYIINYYNREEKTCVSGQSFWPWYREMIEKAINYHDIEHINPSRAQSNNIIRAI